MNPQNDGKNYIVTSGLKMGDKIVSQGLSSLQDGAEIKAVSEAQYNEDVKKAEKLGEKQSSAGGFIDAMTGKDDDK